MIQGKVDAVEIDRYSLVQGTGNHQIFTNDLDLTIETVDSANYIDSSNTQIKPAGP
jgi:hypothetical protein